jgi:hypothetical protein
VFFPDALKDFWSNSLESSLLVEVHALWIRDAKSLIKRFDLKLEPRLCGLSERQANPLRQDQTVLAAIVNSAEEGALIAIIKSSPVTIQLYLMESRPKVDRF